MPHPYKNSIEEAEMSQPVRSRGGSIFKADFTCPPWFSSSAKKLIKRILDPNPQTRITIAEVIDNEWFKKGYKPPSFEQADVSLDDVDAIFNESGDSTNLVVERREERPANPVSMNAFELISKSQGLNLSSLFEKQMGLVKRETRFTSKCPASEVISKIEEAAVPLGFDVKKNNYKRHPLLLCLSVAPSSI
ncbi:CBL-interacting serine/threonine-protein kinase 23 [Sarracenia purpurea var. burkii]